MGFAPDPGERNGSHRIETRAAAGRDDSVQARVLDSEIKSTAGTALLVHDVKDSKICRDLPACSRVRRAISEGRSEPCGGGRVDRRFQSARDVASGSSAWRPVEWPHGRRRHRRGRHSRALRWRRRWCVSPPCRGDRSRQSTRRRGCEITAGLTPAPPTTGRLDGRPQPRTGRSWSCPSTIAHPRLATSNCTARCRSHRHIGDVRTGEGVDTPALVAVRASSQDPAPTAGPCGGDSDWECAPGDYLVRATVTVNDAVVGQVRRSVHKEASAQRSDQ